MAVRTREEIMESLQTIFGENADDDSITLIEDVSDTFDDYETRTNDDWKKKFEDNDKEWRHRYTERFFSKEPEVKKEPEDEPKVLKTFDDLFKQEV